MINLYLQSTILHVRMFFVRYTSCKYSQEDSYTPHLEITLASKLVA